MRVIILLYIFFSSLICVSQTTWEGEFLVKYEKELKISRESKVKIWMPNDSSHQMRWSFNAFQRGEWIWENSGYCIVHDSGRLELYLDNYKDQRIKVQTKVMKKLKMGEFFYIITKDNAKLYIDAAKQKDGKLELIKS